MRLYLALSWLLLPFAIARLWWRGRRLPGYRQGLWQRLGRPQAVPKGRRCIWLHAVSVGEAQAASALVEALLKRYPEDVLVVSTHTPTGADRVRALFGDRVRHCFAPFDLPFAVRGFCRRLNVRALLVMETEIWPQWLAQCGSLDVPVLLLNARMSQRSARGYRRFSTLTAATLARFSAIVCASQADAQRFEDLGAPPHVVSVSGNLKFDLEVAPSVRERGEALRAQLASVGGGDRPVWVAASTHEGEEEAVLAAHELLLAQLPNALLLLVPRHPDRFDQVAALVARFDAGFVRRSCAELPGAGCSVYLCDTMGELPVLFSAADLAFVGGSLKPVGGHNVLEPAALGCPVLVGPHVFNFADLTASLIAAHGALVVTDAKDLADACERLLRDSVQRAAMAQSAARFVDENKGALARSLERLTPFLDD